MATFREVLLELMDLPGATYSCVADRVSGTLLGEVGASSVAPGVVMEWGGGAASFLATASGDGLDDLMITSHRSYHLVRPVGGDTRQLLMIYLCLDRGRSNLAVARRELASARLHRRLATAAIGPPGPAPGEAARRAAPTAVPALRSGSSPAVALLSRPPEPGSNGRRAAVSAPRTGAPADPGPAATGAVDEPRLAPSPVPLPRRAGPSRVPPPVAPAVPPTSRTASVEPSAGVRASLGGQTWATDVGTMRRLLTGLRALR